MKGYGEYKATGLPWLNEVPSHWKIYRGKQLFVSINCRSESGTEELLSVSATHGVVKRKDVNVTMFQASSYQGYKLCWPDDLVINSLWAWQRGLGFSKYHGIISTAYSVFRLKNREASNPRYYNYFMRGSDYIWELYVRSKGIWKSRYQLSDDDFLRSPIISPPREEQDQIVRYLDAKVGKINKLIKIKQQQIALLKEKKQAIINQAVTRGLDPNAPMKDSGIAWIGKIPEGWEVTKLKHLISRIDQGVSPQAEARLASSDEWGVLKAGCVNYGIFREREHKALPHGYAVDESLSIHVGDMLISRACGSAHLVGSVGIVNELHFRLILCDKIFRPVFKDERVKIFCYYAMNSSYFKNQTKEAISGAEGLANNLPITRLKDFIIAIPHVALCHEISKHLKKQSFNFDLLCEYLLKKVATLTEYRTRLISDVVTGKVDVRGLAVSDTCEEEQKNVIDGHPWLAQEDEDEYSVDDPEEQME